MTDLYVSVHRLATVAVWANLKAPLGTITYPTAHGFATDDGARDHPHRAN